MLSKSTNKLIKFYKGYILTNIHSHLTKNHAYSIQEVDDLIKYRAGLNKSCSDMSKDELIELITESFSFGDEVGCYLNYPNNECEFIREL